MGGWVGGRTCARACVCVHLRRVRMRVPVCARIVLGICFFIGMGIVQPCPSRKRNVGRLESTAHCYAALSLFVGGGGVPEGLGGASPQP